MNRAGQKLLAQPATRLLGRTSAELGLAACLDREEGEGSHIMQIVFPGGLGRWDIRRRTFREGGAQHQLLVLTDLSQTLREEERIAWQRWLRVLGHELNNSLTPIKSVAGSLADPQLEQLLINLVRNAVDALMETRGGVGVGWTQNNRQVEVWISDEAPGLASTANLFVPFFTTKAKGSGIGLVLSRQIAEAHGGTLTLENRPRGRGCEALLRLPL